MFLRFYFYSPCGEITSKTPILNNIRRDFSASTKYDRPVRLQSHQQSKPENVISNFESYRKNVNSLERDSKIFANLLLKVGLFLSAETVNTCSKRSLTRDVWGVCVDFSGFSAANNAPWRDVFCFAIFFENFHQPKDEKALIQFCYLTSRQRAQ